jgi:hypothetical protein
VQHPGDKKALTILAAAAAAVVVLIAGLTAVLVVTSDDDHVPTVSVQAGDTFVQVQPAYWCERDMTDCTPADPRTAQQVPTQVARAATPVGSTMLLTVPEEIASGPWFAFAQYATPKGLQRVVTLNRSDSKYTMELTSTPDRVLLGVDIQSVATVLDNSPNGLNSPDGSILMRGVFSVDARPDGYTVTNVTELPDTRA